MAKFCLLPEYVDAFKKGLRDRQIDPAKLATLSSEERHAFLGNFVGKDNALQVNSLFESKLLLKNQKAGYITWAKKIGGITPETRRDLISRIEKMDRVLSPKEGEQFLRDLAETRLGVGVSETEAKTIFDLTQKVKETRVPEKEDLTFSSETERLNYGRSKVALMNYVNGLKEEAGKLNLLDRLKPTNYLKNVSDIAGNAKSIKASMDNSAIFRQGWKTLFTNPLIWQRNARKTFVDIFKTFGGKQVMDELNADIVSRPNYDRMVKAKLAVGTIEESFPGTVIEKVPLVNRVYKASENAFTGFIYRQRADIFDKYLEIAKKSGINIDDVDELKPIASMVNSLTGRGNFGKFEGSAVNAFNNVFFSPRFMKSQFDTLLHPLTGAGGSNFVRKQAAVNLLKVISGTATVLTIANAIKPNSVEWDPRSADFGKIKIGNTRFDVTGGMSSLITLAARLATMSSKSTTTGAVSPINSGKFGSTTGLDLVENFFENKAAPAVSVFRDILKGEDFKGNKPTLTSSLESAFLPIGVSTFKELNDDPNAANIVLAMIADGLGIGATNRAPQKTNWLKNPGAEIKQFQAKVGNQKVKEANEKYNKEYSQWLFDNTKGSKYKSLSDEEKQKIVSDKKEEIRNKIFKEYGFKYKQPPREKKKSGSLFK